MNITRLDWIFTAKLREKKYGDYWNRSRSFSRRLLPGLK